MVPLLDVVMGAHRALLEALPLVGSTRAMSSPGNLIRERRKRKGLTQQQLADSFDPPVTKTTVYRWEHNRGHISLAHCQRLVELLGGELSDYLAGEPEADPLCLLDDDLEALVAEVRHFVEHVLKAGEPLRPSSLYTAEAIGQMFAVWQAWLADPEHPNVADLKWLRSVIAASGRFRAHDPLRSERRTAGRLIDRMLGKASLDLTLAVEVKAPTRGQIVGTYIDAFDRARGR